MLIETFKPLLAPSHGEPASGNPSFPVRRPAAEGGSLRPERITTGGQHVRNRSIQENLAAHLPEQPQTDQQFLTANGYDDVENFLASYQSENREEEVPSTPRTPRPAFEAPDSQRRNAVYGALPEVPDGGVPLSIGGLTSRTSTSDGIGTLNFNQATPRAEHFSDSAAAPNRASSALLGIGDDLNINRETFMSTLSEDKLLASLREVGSSSSPSSDGEEHIAAVIDETLQRGIQAYKDRGEDPDLPENRSAIERGAMLHFQGFSPGFVGLFSGMRDKASAAGYGNISEEDTNRATRYYQSLQTS